jgi:hypothetical protein
MRVGESPQHHSERETAAGSCRLPLLLLEPLSVVNVHATLYSHFAACRFLHSGIMWRQRCLVPLGTQHLRSTTYLSCPIDTLYRRAIDDRTYTFYKQPQTQLFSECLGPRMCPEYVYTPNGRPKSISKIGTTCVLVIGWASGKRGEKSDVWSMNSERTWKLKNLKS